MVKVIGNQLYDNLNRELHLAGAGKGGMLANVSGSNPNSKHNRKEMFQKFGERDGGNFLVFAMNPQLWFSNPTESAKYRANVQTYVDYCHEYGIYFQLKLQRFGQYADYDGDPNPPYSTASSNWKITDPNAAGNTNGRYKARAIEFWKDLATLYGDDPNLAGYSLLCEPWGNNNEGQKYEKWGVVRDYYLDCIDAVTPIDPDAVFYVMEPWHWGYELINWANSPGGYLPRPNVVYEFHVYYDHWVTRDWGLEYAEGRFVSGDTKMRQWHNTHVVPVQNAGYPVFNGEFGTMSGSDGSRAPNFARALQGQIQDMNALGIHYSQMMMIATHADNNLYMMNDDGTEWNAGGMTLINNLPDDLLRPSDNGNGGEEVVKVTNASGVELTIYKTKVVLTETPIVIAPGQTVPITVADDETLVWKN